MICLVRLIFLVSIGVLMTACQPSGRDSAEPLQTVERVDLDRYLGRWFEIARFDNRFERGCDGVTADYALRDDGLISVTNTCYQGGLDGDRREANGRARVVDGSRNTKLEVSFFGPFWGDYWVIGLDEDYQWALVSEPEGRFLWILAREPQMDEEVLSARLEELEAMGFDTAHLIYPEQWPDADSVRL